MGAGSSKILDDIVEGTNCMFIGFFVIFFFNTACIQYLSYTRLIFIFLAEF